MNGWSDDAQGEGRGTEGWRDGAHGEGRGTEGWSGKAHGEGRDTEGWSGEAPGEGLDTEGWSDGAHGEARDTEGWSGEVLGEGRDTEGWSGKAHGEGLSVGGWSIEPLGDSAYIASPPQRAASRDLPALLSGAAARLRALGAPWLSEVVPAYDSLTVHLRLEALYDARAGAESAAIVAAVEAEGGTEREVRRRIDVPVVFGGDGGPDLAEAAARADMTEAAFVRAFAEADYDVAMIGFAPGFPYLRGLPDALAQPRRDTPRLRVPAGSVGIAGKQAGVYSVDSPGGWQLIGRTPLPLFRPASDEPFLLRAGDRVRFVPMAAEEAGEGSKAGDRMACSHGAFEAQTREGADRSVTCAPIAAGAAGEGGETASDEGAALTVLTPGVLATVQDLGRTGWQAFGVSVGGAMDRDALRLANRLVDNEEGAAGLELTLLGGELRFERDCLVALAGAALDARVNGVQVPLLRPVLLRQGARLAFGRAAFGCRAYLAVAGGIDVPPALGSRSTDARAAIGGFRGRALAAGDALRGGRPSDAALRLAAGLRERALAGGALWAAPLAFASAAARGGAYAAGGPGPGAGREPLTLRAMPGLGWHRFSPAAQTAFAGADYIVQPSSNRMGLRFSGPPLLPEAGGPETVSHGVAPGAVQVPADGRPIALAAECQPTGGYPIVAHVIAADLGRLAQLKPGDAARFKLVGLEEARAAYREKERQLAIQAAAIRLRWFPRS